MKCSNCQQPLLEDDQFCPNCGQPVVRQAPPAPPAYHSPSQQIQIPPAQQPSISGGLDQMPRWMLFGGIGLLVLICFGVVAVGGYLLMGGQNEIAAPPVDPEVANLQATVIAQQAAIVEQSSSQGQPAQQQEVDAGNVGDQAAAAAPGVMLWFDTSMMQAFHIVPPEEIWDEESLDTGVLVLDFEKPNGTLMIFPVAEYSVWLGNSKVFGELAQAISTGDKAALSECIPMPVQPCDLQAYNVQVVKQYFQNGSGIRSVSSSVYNDTVAFNNESILYQFNGLTTDQQFYVVAFFDIQHEYLPEDDWYYAADKIDKSIQDGYLDDVFEALSDADGYSPSLTSIDMILTTLRIEKE